MSKHCDPSEVEAFFDMIRRNDPALQESLRDKPELAYTLDPGSGGTPLHIAARHKHHAICMDFINLEGLIQAKNHRGDTALHIAVAQKCSDTYEALIQKGAPIEAHNSLGDTALHIAAWENNKHACETLIAEQADLEAKNRRGNTPLNLAAQNGAHAAYNILKDAGADPNAQNSKGSTPQNALEEYQEFQKQRETLKIQKYPRPRSKRQRHSTPKPRVEAVQQEPQDIPLPRPESGNIREKRPLETPGFVVRAASKPFSWMWMGIAAGVLAAVTAVGILAWIGVIPALAAIGASVLVKIGTILAGSAFLVTACMMCWQMIHARTVAAGIPTQATADQLVSGQISGHPDAFQYMPTDRLRSAIMRIAIPARLRKAVHAGAVYQGLEPDRISIVRIGGP